jgi:hypothetical protein
MAQSMPIDPASLASLASLQGTLSSGDILSLSEALNQRAMAEAQRRTAQATQEASQAGQAYGQAAAAPMQTPDALAQMLPLLTGNIASVIAQDPSFAKRGAEEVGQRRADLARTRADNLIALKDNYDKKAILAAHLGDQETEMDMRQRSEQLSKTLQVLLQGEHEKAAKENIGLQHQNQLSEIEAQGRQARLTQGEKPKPSTPLKDEPIDFNKFVKTSYGKRKYLSLGGLTGDVANKLRIQAATAGIPIPDKPTEAGVTDVARAQLDLDKLEKDVLPLVPRDSEGRILGAFNRKISTLTQKNPARAAFRVWSDAAIPVLRATAGSKNLRITQEQVRLAISNIPTQNDTWSTVEKKLAILRSLLGNAESSLLDADVSPKDVADPLGIL